MCNRNEGRETELQGIVQQQLNRKLNQALANKCKQKKKLEEVKNDLQITNPQKIVTTRVVFPRRQFTHRCGHALFFCVVPWPPAWEIF